MAGEEEQPLKPKLFETNGLLSMVVMTCAECCCVIHVMNHFILCQTCGQNNGPCEESAEFEAFLHISYLTKTPYLIPDNSFIY